MNAKELLDFMEQLEIADLNTAELRKDSKKDLLKIIELRQREEDKIKEDTVLDEPYTSDTGTTTDTSD